eukprot:CAMPEP_0168547718 /NCGR_PEP_ID=MMETSP0413-20121227/4184_1 /TAXON_ID=136452 /ORGANISM="Filamoeba nolandi, Strain NC-AS-23-1" /LENGTH=1073 /DNA_ID=CAMNT_0008577987 /DNA_START=51 /DNA_END=3269 /DNA_ORIENTATION=-
MLRKKQQSSENLPQMKIGSVESEPDLWKAANLSADFFLGLRRRIQRSKSEELLPSWDQPDFEELKAKFDALIKHRKNGELDKEFAADYLDLLNDSDSASNSDSMEVPSEKRNLNHSSGSYGSGKLDIAALARESIDTDEDLLTVPPKFSETKLEEEDKLLVGVAEGKEIILGGTVDELFSLISKRFGKITTAKPNTLQVPQFVSEFLFTYRYFASTTPASDGTLIPASHELMDRLETQYPFNIPSNANPEQLSLEGAVQLRIIGVLKEWMDHHFYDFENDEILLSQLCLFVADICININQNALSASNGVQTWGLHLFTLLEAKLMECIKRGKYAPLACTLRTFNFPPSQNKTQGHHHPRHRHNRRIATSTEHIFFERIKEMCLRILGYHIKKSPFSPKTEKESNKSFSGTVLVDWLMKTLNIETREEASTLAELLVTKEIIINQKKGGKFSDKTSSLYIIPEKRDKKKEQHYTNGPEGQITHTSISAVQASNPLFGSDDNLRVNKHIAPKPSLPKNPKSISFIDLKPVEVARQLTLIDFNNIRRITPQELSHQAWNKAHSKELAPNVVEMITRFNTVNYWVATELVMCPNIKKRNSILKRFIQIADQLQKLNNFNSMIAILVGLSLGAVQRMSKTWESLPKQYSALFNEMQEFTSSHGNFRTLRKAIRTLQLEGEPVIPHMAIILRDLTFIEDGNQNFRPNGMVNFEKMSMLAKVFAQVQSYQRQVYNLIEVPSIRDFLLNVYAIKDDKSLYKYSNQCEGSAVAPQSGQRGLYKIASHADVSQLTSSPSSGLNRSGSGLVRSPSSDAVSGMRRASPLKKSQTENLGMARPSTTQSIFKSVTDGSKRVSASQSAPDDYSPTIDPNNRPERLTPSIAPRRSGMKKSLKIVLVGDGMVGKTTLLISYTTKAYPQTEYIPTVFDNYSSIEENDGQQVNLILWDTAGQEDLKNIRTLNYTGTDCFIVCYSVENRSSYFNISEKWIPEILDHCRDPIIVIAGLKSDLLTDKDALQEASKNNQALITVEEGEKLAKKHNALFHIQCSAKANTNVQDLFVKALKGTMTVQSQPKKKSSPKM